ncbi:MAG: hypothetical protein AAGI01_08570 [Myxococcota bacterium]
MQLKHQESDPASRWITGATGGRVADAFDVTPSTDGVIQLGRGRWLVRAHAQASGHTMEALVAWCAAPIVRRAWRERAGEAGALQALRSLELPEPGCALYAQLHVFGTHLSLDPDAQRFDCALDRIVIAVLGIPLSERLAVSASD